MRRFHHGRFTGTLRSASVALTFLLIAGCTGTSKAQVKVQTSTTAPKSPATVPVADCAESLPPSAQAGQLLMVMVTTPSLAKKVVDNATVGGFGLKGRQAKTVGEQIQEAVSGAPLKPFVASDEEGGTVQRLTAALGALPSATKLAQGTPEEAGRTIGDYAREMAGIGVNMSFAPVADVGSGSGLGTRSFGDDPAVVSKYVTASVTAQQDAGLIATVKHWPGIGGGDTDPHQAIESVASIAELAQKDLIPFNAAFKAGAKAVMVAHVEVPGLTEDGIPASLSSAAITGQLRDHDGFKGLVITDSLGMGAIVQTFTQDEAAERAIAAGADIALLSGADVVPAAHQRLTDAITNKRISQARVEDAVRRVLAAKGITGECPDLVASIATAQQSLTTSSDNAGTETDSGGGSGGGVSGNTGSGGTLSTGAGQVDTGINDTTEISRTSSNTSD